MKKNSSPAHQIDFYKADHRSQYPKGTNIVFSNLTPRKSRVAGIDQIVFFGLQYFILEYIVKQWKEEFFDLPKEEVIGRYKRRIETALGPGAITFNHLEDLHDLGYLPIEIKALPEGSFVPMRVPCLVMFNTKPNFFWLTNYLETIMSCVVWGPSTSATTAYEYKKILNEYADKTVGNRDFVTWQAHDFSFRGMFGLEAAKMSGAGHLLHFSGTDTIPAIDFLEQYYLADAVKELIGGSVYATEHSVACSTILDFVNKIRIESDGKIVEDELMDLADIEYVKHLITVVYPKGIISIVSDSFDYWNTITKTAKNLKPEIMSREGKVVFRPDTGDPVEIICGSNEAGVPDHVRKGSVECLWEIFGGTQTDKGYKLLDSHVGLIYGDSITTDRCRRICQGMMDKGFASFNIVLGVGSYTYQYVTRDTYGFAVKATYVEVNNDPRPIYKQPKTGDGTKNSAKGLLAVYKSENDGSYELHNEVTWAEVHNCEFKTVFKDGVADNIQTLSQIRERISKCQ